LVTGHKAAVLDIEFSPFNPYVLATASEDCMVKIWALPQDGLKEELKVEAQNLKGHKRKAGTVSWHPTSNNVLATSGADFVVKIWDVETGDSKLDVEGHGNIIQSVRWSDNGSQIVTACKDKKLRLFDPRQGSAIQEWHAHDGVKGPRALFCGRSGLICSAGTGKTSERQLFIWDQKKLDAPIYKLNVDNSSGQLMCWFDDDLNILWAGGKGDGNIRYYELDPAAEKIDLFELSQFKSAEPQKGLAMVPKRALDVTTCEIARFLKLTPKDIITPISFQVPRKSELFQDDIYPDTFAGVPAQDAAAFFGGSDVEPTKVSLEPKEGQQKKSEVAEVSFKKKAEEKELSPKEIKEEWEALKKRVAYLEAELAKRDAQIKDLQAK
jgi:coronin-1B/1C/6